MPDSKQYIFCHAREVRTFITVTAEDQDAAAQLVHQVVNAGGTFEEPPAWLDDVEVDESDPGEVEFREER